uniref:Uncharacterized protein n=1 Tax=Arundo donax TaxID=35708 RepID=A0A0A9ACR8_ARUDO
MSYCIIAINLLPHSFAKSLECKTVQGLIIATTDSFVN